MARKRSKSQKKKKQLKNDQVKKTQETNKMKLKRKKKYRLTNEQKLQIQERIDKIIDTNTAVLSIDRYRKKNEAENTENTETCKTVNDAAPMAAYPIAIQKVNDQVDAGSCISPNASLETGGVKIEKNAVDKVLNSSVCTANLHTTGNEMTSNVCDLIKSVSYAATTNFVQIPSRNLLSVNTDDCAATLTGSANPVIQQSKNNSNQQKNMNITNASLLKPTTQYTQNAAVLKSLNISGHYTPQPVQSYQLVNYAANKNAVQIPCNNVPLENATDSAPPVIQQSNNNSNQQKNMNLTKASLLKPTPNPAIATSSKISNRSIPHPFQSNQLVPILVDGKLYQLRCGFLKTVNEIRIAKPVAKESAANKNPELNIVQKETTSRKVADQSRMYTIKTTSMIKQICKEINDRQSLVAMKKASSNVDDNNKLASENIFPQKESSSFENINMNMEVFSFQGTEIKKEILEDNQTLHQKTHGQELPRVSNKTLPSCTTTGDIEDGMSQEVEEEENEKENEEEEIETEEESTDDDTEEEIDYECPCGRFFYDLAKYTKHIWTCKNKDSDFELSGSNSESDVPEYLCSKCGEVFSKAVDLKKHESNCACISDYDDNEDESSVKKLKNSLTEKAKMFRYTIGWINSKGKIIYKEKFVPKNEKICADCNESLFGETMYEYHMLMHENDKAGISFECQICQEIFSTEMKLQVHENKAHAAKHRPFQCKQCHRKFRSASETDRHMVVHGSGQYLYQCNDCSKGFPKREYLVDHMEVHSNNKLGKTIPCEECERTFLCKRDLNKHIRNRHKKYPCETCGKLFSSYRLKVHLESHAEVKRFECSVCKKRFAQRTNRNSHMRVHTGKKPYDCDICSKSFNHKVSLKTHKRSAHNIDWWADNGVKKTKDIVKGKPLWKPLRK